MLDGADPGLSPPACAGVLPDQGLYLGRQNRPAEHGKEKVYGSIPSRSSSSCIYFEN